MSRRTSAILRSGNTHRTSYTPGEDAGINGGDERKKIVTSSSEPMRVSWIVKGVKEVDIKR